MQSFCRIGVVLCGQLYFYPASSKVLPLASYVCVAIAFGGLLISPVVAGAYGWLLFSTVLSGGQQLLRKVVVIPMFVLGDVLPACSPTSFWGGFLIRDFSSQWLLGGFPASLVCHCTLVLPGAFPSKVMFFPWLLSCGPSVLPVLLLFPMCSKASCGVLLCVLLPGYSPELL